MTTALQTDASRTSTTAWSVFAGFYLFIVGVILSSGLSSILSVFAEVINLGGTNFGLVFASPAFVFGAGTWWRIVEQRDSTLYRQGMVVGGATALLTGLLWTTVFVAVWGVEMLLVPMNAFLIALVLGIAVLVGGLAGFPLSFARQQSSGA